MQGALHVACAKKQLFRETLRRRAWRDSTCLTRLFVTSGFHVRAYSMDTHWQQSELVVFDLRNVSYLRYDLLPFLADDEPQGAPAGQREP